MVHRGRGGTVDRDHESGPRAATGRVARARVRPRPARPSSGEQWRRLGRTATGGGGAAQGGQRRGDRGRGRGVLTVLAQRREGDGKAAAAPRGGTAKVVRHCFTSGNWRTAAGRTRGTRRKEAPPCALPLWPNTPIQQAQQDQVEKPNRSERDCRRDAAHLAGLRVLPSRSSIAVLDKEKSQFPNCHVKPM
uniref:Uncharacterized protein K0116D04.32 n=1 Tax=Oryza sativa subsp. indica TaxID=39946 RepID=C8TFC6_ORYSI|nr:hypothetical protein [Oryza sativa Indica Group]BAI39879.1 hypothetical protein [Oryza sativa Indica Group]